MSLDHSSFAYAVVPRRGDFVARIPPGLDAVDVLFTALARELRFPDYFGRNWDALYDLLRDFSWLAEERVVVLHSDLPPLPTEHLSIYLRVLDDSVTDWVPGESHELVVVFPEEVRPTLREMGF